MTGRGIAATASNAARNASADTRAPAWSRELGDVGARPRTPSRSRRRRPPSPPRRRPAPRAASRSCAEQRDRQRVHRRPVEAQHATPPSCVLGEHECRSWRGDSYADSRGEQHLGADRDEARRASVDRIDAALPGATCAHSGSPAGHEPAGRGDEPAAEPAPRVLGLDLEADLPPAAEPAPDDHERCRPSSVQTLVDRADSATASSTRGCATSSSRRSHARRARARRRSTRAARRASAARRPSRSASQHERRGRRSARDKSPGGTRAATSSASMSAASTKCPVNADDRVARRPGRRHHLDHAVGRREPPVRGVVEHAAQRVRAHASSASSSSTAVYGSRRARRDVVDERVEPRALGAPRRPREQLLDHEPAQLGREPGAPARVDRAVRLEDAPGARRSRPTARRRRRRSSRPCARSAAATACSADELEHAGEVAHGLVGARPVGLVDDEDVGDLEQARPSRPAPRRPSPGFTTTIVVSAWLAISTST